MKSPKQYNLSPAKGQAILKFQGRRFPDSVELFETEAIEEVRQKKNEKLFDDKKQTELNSDFRNLLIQGDCLSACAYLKSKNVKIDLVYIDPPFASGANYAKKIYLRNGGQEKLEDNDIAIGEEIMYGDIWQKEDYLNWLYERLLAIRDVMDEKANIYVHLDWHIGHYARILLDEVFGEENFRNEIIWHYSNVGMKAKSKQFNMHHDTIFWYSKSDEWSYKEYYEPREIVDKEYKVYFDSATKKTKIARDENGKPIYIELTEKKVGDVWNLPRINPMANEREEYATQKPETLLERVIKSASEDGMIVADFFSGSATTAKVANDLGRKFIACDIGANAIQTSRDRLVKSGAEFDILKVNDGIRLFRNPAQTTARLFELIDGFKNRKELDLSDFWDGGIVEKDGSYVPIKFIGIEERLTKELLDVILEEIYQIEDTSNNTNGVKIIYAYKDLDIDQSFVNKQLKEANKSQMKVELVALQDLLGSKSEVLFNPDCADIEVKKEGNGFKVEIKKFFSHYLKKKIDEYNAKRNLIDSQKEIKISDSGLELIESVQFDTTLRKDIWTSNLDLEDKASVKDKIKGVYNLKTDKFKIKIRNIAGDEVVIEHS